MWADVRRRVSRGSGDVQTAQRHPMMGTPVDVPVPSSVIVTDSRVGTEGARTSVSAGILVLGSVPRSVPGSIGL